MNPIHALLNRTFGRPRGILGRIGGRLMTRDKREMAEWVLSELNLNPTHHVLEVGFGPGIGIQLATAATPDGSVSGVDYSHEMVEMAKARNEAAINAGRVDLQYDPADDLPYEKAVFDRAFSINSMQVWPDAVAGLREMWRVLKPQGRIALAFTPVADQSQEEIQEFLSRAEFTDIRIQEKELGICASGVKRLAQ